MSLPHIIPMVIWAKLICARERKKNTIIVTVVCFIAILSSAQKTINRRTYEELVVRNTYAKLSYAAQLATIHSVIQEHREKNVEPSSIVLDDRLAKDSVHFELA